jgi:hypothetical protein
MTFAVQAGPVMGFGTKQIADAGLYVENVGHNCDWYQLSLSFCDPRGTGNRRYIIEIDPSDFKALAVAMMRANRDEAIKAFGAALQAEPVPIEQRHRWSPLWAKEAA